ncbi:MAG: bifunctional adenosylcobinamide kinase/adenosylcobinamide-phosphate guanylyltransferase [Lachnospiraceae bacterium]
MRRLIIGGYAQGKLNYVLKKEAGENFRLVEADLPKEEGRVIINHFHLWVRSCLAAKKKPEEELKQWLLQHPDWIILSDEIGNGIVPVDAFEREYREKTGRLLIRLARLADEVERVVCGMGQKIK